MKILLGNYDKVMPKLRRMDYKIEYDMMIKKLISDTLRNTKVPNIDKMLQYMDRNGYYSCRSHSHNNWYGGASQHMWAVYLIAMKLREQRINEPYVAQYATDEKIAIVCLLHDLCDMKVRVFNDNREEITGHGCKSYWIMKNLGVGTEVERKVVRNHMHGNLTIDSNNQDEIDEYSVLHSIITKADHIASGTAWNSKRFKEGRTQRHGVVTKDHSYLRAVAMDRTVQSGLYHMYMDENLKLWTYRNYNRDNIKWEIAPINLSSFYDKKIGNNIAVGTTIY